MSLSRKRIFKDWFTALTGLLQALELKWLVPSCVAAEIWLGSLGGKPEIKLERMQTKRADLVMESYD